LCAAERALLQGDVREIYAAEGALLQGDVREMYAAERACNSVMLERCV
jgi:hypothetical protein